MNIYTNGMAFYTKGKIQNKIVAFPYDVNYKFETRLILYQNFEPLMPILIQMSD